MIDPTASTDQIVVIVGHWSQLLSSALIAMREVGSWVARRRVADRAGR